MSPTIARVFQWLPEDTETLIVARSVNLPDPDPNMSWQELGAYLTPEDDIGKRLESLRNRKLECVVSGSKNFDVVSSFGSLRGESCSIFVFENDLGDVAKKWTENLRKQAKTVRSLLDHEVFVFPSTTVMEPWMKPTEWQGTYYVLLNPRTLLCATSDRYLESILQRVKNVPKARALPESLPEWKYVDFNAPVWMLRHVDKFKKHDQLTGLTVAWKKDGFRVVYVLNEKSDPPGNPLKAERISPFLLLASQGDRERLKIENRPDGTVVVNWDQKLRIEDEVPNPSDIGFVWYLYGLQAAETFTPDHS